MDKKWLQELQTHNTQSRKKKNGRKAGEGSGFYSGTGEGEMGYHDICLVVKGTLSQKSPFIYLTSQNGHNIDLKSHTDNRKWGAVSGLYQSLLIPLFSFNTHLIINT